ncbi:MAG: helix-turn-helix domain-containing protein [Chloroflexi bacterium]|nr:MAG: helix-turn-helix domain-containing protein [Chloroflexota bacterium]
MSEMLTAKDIQDLLQVDRSTVYRMAEAGRIPAIKVGRQWRFPTPQIESWMQTQGTAVSPPITHFQTTHPTDFASQLPVACVQLIQDTFADALGIMIIITDMDGKPITEFSNPCAFFTALSNVSELWDKCMVHWREMAADLSLEPQFMPSFLGLLCARGLIRVGHELKGMVFVGGVAPDNWPLSPTEIEKLADELNIAPERIEAHINDVFEMDLDRRTEVLTFVQRIANIVSHIMHERNALLA